MISTQIRSVAICTTIGGIDFSENLAAVKCVLYSLDIQGKNASAVS